MYTDYRYQLETRRLTGRAQQKTTCPHCGRKKCFVRYVDTHNQCRYVADTVGKCDHQHSCGYHYKPAEYYRDNQWLREPKASEHCTPKPLPPLQPLAVEYVWRSHSPKSIFWQWFATEIASKLSLRPEQVQRVFDDYNIGATRMGNVIFWQIDQHGQVHAGHIMQYRADGHRGGYQGWVHTKLISAGVLPPDWQLYQCLFGEHLLPHRPDAPVCLVESEKTAVLLAALYPQYLWLATCGSGGMNAEKLACLKGRRVTVFPDSGCYDKWLRVMRQTSSIVYTVDSQMEVYEHNTDLVDVLLNEARLRKDGKSGGG